MDRLSELQRRLPRDIFEYHIKVLGIGKPDQSRNSLHRLLGLPQKNHLTNLYECGKIIKSLEERWFFEN